MASTNEILCWKCGWEAEVYDIMVMGLTISRRQKEDLQENSDSDAET